MLYSFVDEAYERSSYCIGGEAEAVTESVLALAQDALARVDFREFAGSHPTLGAVDHVAVNPLDASLETAATAARRIAERLGGEAGVPTLLYGAAHTDGRTLAATRRMTSYFRTTAPAPGDVADVAFDAGPSSVDPRVGMACVGAVNHVLNYNVVLDTTDGAAAKRVAAAVRTRGDGDDRLPCVEALALAHEGRFEVACNLLDVETTPPEKVLARITAAASKESIDVHKEYHIGLTRPQMRDALGSPGVH